MMLSWKVTTGTISAFRAAAVSAGASRTVGSCSADLVGPARNCFRFAQSGHKYGARRGMAAAPSRSPRGFGTLDGLRVIDLTAVLMGPFATQMMADHGAEVIKIEGPDGETTRQVPIMKEPGLGAMFLNLNRGKRSLCLDLKKPEAREAVLRLVKDADVFIHSMRADAIARLGLTYAEISEKNPKIIYANVYGFSRRGPYASKPAYDDVIQAMSGMAGVQQQMQGAPTYSGTLVADQVSGLTALYAVLMALFHRERTGVGQEIEVTMFETMVNFVLTGHMNGSLFVPSEGPPIYPRAASPNRKPYQTKDGFIAVLVYTDRQFSSFVELAGNPEWAQDPRMGSLKKRAAIIDEFYTRMGDTMRTRTTEEWLAGFEEKGIPAAKVNSTADLLEDPHLKETGFFIEQETDRGYGMKFPGMPAFFSHTPGRVDGPARPLGQDSRVILAENGFTEEEIAALERQKALVVPEERSRQ